MECFLIKYRETNVKSPQQPIKTKEEIPNYLKRGTTRATKSRLVLVLHLIFWERGASFWPITEWSKANLEHAILALNESDAGSYVHVTAAKLWWMPKSNVMHTFVFIEETCRGWVTYLLPLWTSCHLHVFLTSIAGYICIQTFLTKRGILSWLVFYQGWVPHDSPSDHRHGNGDRDDETLWTSLKVRKLYK